MADSSSSDPRKIWPVAGLSREPPGEGDSHVGKPRQRSIEVHAEGIATGPSTMFCRDPVTFGSGFGNQQLSNLINLDRIN
jgi:hypothetical protein